MKRFPLFLLVIVAVALLLPAIASSQGRMRMSVDDRVKQLTEQLTLTKDQAEKAKVILTASQNDMQAMRDSLAGDREGMRKAMTELRTKSNKKIAELLTDDQKPKFEKMLKDQEEMMRQRMQGGGGN
jgi:Spy/CpxP family protein refolding chaperone